MEELDDLDGIKRNIEAVAVMMVNFSPGKQEDIASALDPVHTSTRRSQKFDGPLLNE